MGRVLAAIVGARRAVAMSAMIAMRRRLKGVAMDCSIRSCVEMASRRASRVIVTWCARGSSVVALARAIWPFAMLVAIACFASIM